MRDSTGKWCEMKAGLEPKVLSPQGHPGFRKDEFHPRLILSPFPKKKPSRKGSFYPRNLEHAFPRRALRGDLAVKRELRNKPLGAGAGGAQGVGRGAHPRERCARRPGGALAARRASTPAACVRPSLGSFPRGSVPPEPPPPGPGADTRHSPFCLDAVPLPRAGSRKRDSGLSLVFNLLCDPGHHSPWTLLHLWELG